MAAPDEGLLKDFLTEIKSVEQQDSQWTSPIQIARLLKPGSKYLNLNPFEVLQLAPEATEEQLKKQYRRLSILVHPDKNRDNQDEARRAFEIVQDAFKIIHDEERMGHIREVIFEGKQKLKAMMDEARPKSKDGLIPEDNPVQFEVTLRKETLKLFAFYEKRKEDLAAQDARLRKREREQEIEEEGRKKVAYQAQKEWDNGREQRMNSWQTFAKSASDPEHKKEKKGVKLLKPPKLKLETKLK